MLHGSYLKKKEIKVKSARLLRHLLCSSHILNLLRDSSKLAHRCVARRTEIATCTHALVRGHTCTLELSFLSFRQVSFCFFSNRSLPHFPLFHSPSITDKYLHTTTMFVSRPWACLLVGFMLTLQALANVFAGASEAIFGTLTHLKLIALRRVGQTAAISH